MHGHSATASRAFSHTITEPSRSSQGPSDWKIKVFIRGQLKKPHSVQKKSPIRAILSGVSNPILSERQKPILLLQITAVMGQQGRNSGPGHNARPTEDRISCQLQSRARVCREITAQEEKPITGSEMYCKRGLVLHVTNRMNAFTVSVTLKNMALCGILNKRWRVQ